MLLAAYENAMAWLAISEWHQEQARQAARMAAQTLAWALAHPEQPADLPVRALRRWIAQQSAQAN